MTLAFAVDIAGRDNRTEMLRELVESMPGPVTYHVFDGRFASHSIRSEEIPSVAEQISECSIILVLDSSRGGLREPIAGLIANEPLGIAKLQFLIDDRPAASDGRIPRRTMEMLGIYIRTLFAEFCWIDTVSVPANVQLLDGFFQLTVETEETSLVSLKDRQHRPESARRR